MQKHFPGMNPWLEGHLWPDVHQSLAYMIKKILSKQVRPKYAVALNVYTVEDTMPSEDVGIVYPDAGIYKVDKVEEPTAIYGQFTPPTIVVENRAKVEVKIPTVEIVDTQNNQLITAIEILSYVNKRNPGLKKYRKKRIKLQESGVHLLEVDLLRRGIRPYDFSSMPKSHYYTTLLRAGTFKMELWAMSVMDELPIVPVPLKSGDKDAVLDLGKAFKTICADSEYDLLIDYNKIPPPPEFEGYYESWVKNKIG